LRLRSIVAGTAIVVVLTAPVRAEVLLGGQVGAGPLRFNQLEDFWNDFNLHHDTNPLALYWELSATWRFAERHAIRLGIERITTSVVLYTIPPFGVLTTEQNFDAVPVCLSYEFLLLRSEGGSSTSLGLGGGIYRTEIEGIEAYYNEDPTFNSIQHHSREGEGYGFHGYVRQTAPITDRLSLSAMIRGRWADGMAFEEDDGSIPVDFTGLDVDLGLEWKF
jgi:hypothetical protein